jgi:hypothetical protein
MAILRGTIYVYLAPELVKLSTSNQDGVFPQTSGV